MGVEYYKCEKCGVIRAEDFFRSDDFTGPCTICESAIKKGMIINKLEAKEP